MKAVAFVAAIGIAIAPFACDGQPLSNGAREPLRVRGAQFVRGDLPGTPPLPAPDAEAPEAGADAGPVGPPPLNVVTTVETANNVVLPGAAAKKITGRTTASAVAIALRLVDLGTGYWVQPLGTSDPQAPGELTFDTSIDFDVSISPGYHLLRFAAVDANGGSGVERDVKLCFASRVPDNLNACEPTIAPPEAVIALQWDADADLDLQVTTPDGRVVEPKHPTTVLVDAGRPGPEVGLIDRDSLGSCVPDGLRQENLVFQQRPKGTFSLAVNLFDACKKPGATFRLAVYEATGDGPARHLEETFHWNGRVSDIDANGGSKLGLFIYDYPFGD